MGPILVGVRSRDRSWDRSCLGTNHGTDHGTNLGTDLGTDLGVDRGRDLGWGPITGPIPGPILGPILYESLSTSVTLPHPARASSAHSSHNQYFCILPTDILFGQKQVFLYALVSQNCGHKFGPTECRLRSHRFWVCQKCCCVFCVQFPVPPCPVFCPTSTESGFRSHRFGCASSPMTTCVCATTASTSTTPSTTISRRTSTCTASGTSPPLICSATSMTTIMPRQPVRLPRRLPVFDYYSEYYYFS